MKIRHLNHKDDWKTPDYLYDELNKEFDFIFDPCPFHHDISEWDGLVREWLVRNYINPPYSLRLKTAFVKKAIAESRKGKLCVMLIPVSTSTSLFHDYILPNATDIRFIRRRIKFVGINSKEEYVNWDMCDLEAPDGVTHVKNSGMHDSMIVIFDGRVKSKMLGKDYNLLPTESQIINSRRDLNWYLPYLT